MGKHVSEPGQCQPLHPFAVAEICGQTYIQGGPENWTVFRSLQLAYMST